MGLLDSPESPPDGRFRDQRCAGDATELANNLTGCVQDGLHSTDSRSPTSRWSPRALEDLRAMASTPSVAAPTPRQGQSDYIACLHALG